MNLLAIDASGKMIYLYSKVKEAVCFCTGYKDPRPNSQYQILPVSCIVEVLQWDPEDKC